MRKKKRLCGIYKITNVLNDVCYIGQSIDIKRRFNEHRRILYDNDLCKALKEYGIENFSFEIIELCEKEKLNLKEVYWISYYDSYYHGYNMTTGGEGGYKSGHHRPVAKYDIEGNFIAAYESITEAEEMNNINYKASNISRVCQGKAYESNGFQWRYIEKNINYKLNIGRSPLKEKRQLGQKMTVQKRTKIIARCDLQTHEILQIYHGFSEVEKDGFNRSTICNICNGKGKCSKGYFWKYI